MPLRKAITQKEGIYFRCFKMCNAYGAVYTWYNKGLHCCTGNPRGVLRKKKLNFMYLFKTFDTNKISMPGMITVQITL